MKTTSSHTPNTLETTGVVDVTVMMVMGLVVVMVVAVVRCNGGG